MEIYMGNSMNTILERAKQGYAEAQLVVGNNYLQGSDGFPENDTEAFKWFKRAAEKNHPMGLCMVGEMYQYGYGVEKDYDEALKWYYKSAEFNCGRAEFRIGWLYVHAASLMGRISISPSAERAVYFYSRAIEHGYMDDLGVLQVFSATGGLM